MIEQLLDYTKPYRVVVYLRMSDEDQNPRSPEQQLAEIKRRLAMLKFPWIIVAVYRDDALTGRKVWKRPGFKKMITDIRSLEVTVDLVLVDTAERFGRADEIAQIRRELYHKSGVVLLTADTNFADPNTPQGKALTAFEQLRSTEDSRIKAHNVSRGKRDATKQGQWPGGTPPLGYRLKSVMGEDRGREVVKHSTVEPDPTTAWIVRRMFALAHEKGWGQVRIARALNADPDIPEAVKPLTDSRVGWCLQNELYRGVMVWGKYSRDIIDDTYVRKTNEASDIARAEGFCEPIVDPEIWEQVNEQRRRRGEQAKANRKKSNPAEQKLIRPTCPGLALKYPLTGLLRCAHCGRSMRPQAEAYKETHYLRYLCPGIKSGQCPNNRYIDGHWLWPLVVETIRTRLLSPRSEWLPYLLEEVRKELGRLQDAARPDTEALRRERLDLQLTIDGLGHSLGNPQLDYLVRADVEERQSIALKRRHEIDGLLEQVGRQSASLDTLLDIKKINRKLDQLAEVLASDNPSRLNLELSLHIDRIDCFSDGHVEQRTCRLGGLAGVCDTLMACSQQPNRQPASVKNERSQLVLPRVRPKLRVIGSGPVDSELVAATYMAADPNRFAGLGDEWFWIDRFEKPVVLSWPREHAAEVLKMRLETGLSYEKLGKHFGKSKYTMCTAVKIALEAGGLPGPDGGAAHGI